MQALNAQVAKVVSDLEQRTSIDISKKLNEHWKLSLNQEFRFTHNASNFDTYFVGLGVDYRFNKHFSLGADYRFYQNKNKEGFFMSQQRWSADLMYKQKLSRFSVSYRLRLQNKDDDFMTSASGDNLFQLRNKFSVDYNIKNFKLDPFFDVELYRSFENPGSSEFSKLRWTLGLNYSLKEFGGVEFFYRLDNELNQPNNKNTYIVGLGYKYSF